jgi:hypothetical protein
VFRRNPAGRATAAVCRCCPHCVLHHAQATIGVNFFRWACAPPPPRQQQQQQRPPQQSGKKNNNNYNNRGRNGRGGSNSSGGGGNGGSNKDQGANASFNSIGWVYYLYETFASSLQLNKENKVSC